MASAIEAVIDAAEGIVSDSPGRSISNTAKDDGRYLHDTLPDPSTHIRLLEPLDPDSWDTYRIQCRLTVFPLEEAPLYHAISYLWGDPTPRGIIHVDDRALRVPDSSVAVLRQLAHLQLSRYYWIDAICIAQGDIPEKNGQVAIMGRIYEQAEHVQVCLGCDEMIEEEIFMMAEIDACIPSASDALLHLDDEALYSSEVWTDKRLKDMHDGFTMVLEQSLRLLGSRFGPFLYGTVRLSHSPYFHRVWIVQELLLAKMASICCGEANVPMPVAQYCMRLAHGIHTFATPTSPDAHLVKEWVRQHVPKDFISAAFAPSETMDLLRYYDHRHRETNVMPYYSPVRFSVEQAILLAQDRMCVDKRDKVYGLLSLTFLSELEGSTAMRPDYDICTLDLAVDYLRHAPSDGIDLQTIDILLKSLDLELSDTNVQRLLACRRNGTGDAYTYKSRAHSSASNRRVKAYARGLHITEGLQRIGRSQYRFSCQFDGSSSTRIRFYASSALEGDWLILRAYSNRLRTRYLAHGFIVRCRGHSYEIISRAYVVDAMPPMIGTKEFDLWFYHEDYAILSLMRHIDISDSRIIEVVETPVCRWPGSSVARDAGDEMSWEHEEDLDRWS